MRVKPKSAKAAKIIRQRGYTLAEQPNYFTLEPEAGGYIVQNRSTRNARRRALREPVPAA